MCCIFCLTSNVERGLKVKASRAGQNHTRDQYKPVMMKIVGGILLQSVYVVLVVYVA